MDELKLQYNNLIQNYKKAEKYMDCYTLTGEALELAVAERMNHVPRLELLLAEMDKLLEQIGTYTELEGMEGFKIDMKEAS